MRDLLPVAPNRVDAARQSQSLRPASASFLIELLAAALIAVALLASGIVSGNEADDTDSPGFRFNSLITMGISGGGDTIARYRGWFLGEPAEFEVDAGGDVLIFGGVNLRWPRRSTGFIVQAGLFSGGSGNFEQRAEFSRIPLELIAVYDWKRFRGGLGVTHHFSPKFRDEGIANFGLDFDDATGIVWQLDYLLPRFDVGLRHVAIDYTLSNSRAAPRLDGDHWGVTGTYRFGDRR